MRNTKLIQQAHHQEARSIREIVLHFEDGIRDIFMIHFVDQPHTIQISKYFKEKRVKFFLGSGYELPILFALHSHHLEFLKEEALVSYSSLEI